MKKYWQVNKYLLTNTRWGVTLPSGAGWVPDIFRDEVILSEVVFLALVLLCALDTIVELSS